MSDNSTSLGNISVGIGLDLAGLVTGMAQAKSLLGGFGALAAGAIGAVADIGVDLTKSAGDWQSSMTMLVTGAGENQKAIGMVGDGLLKIADDTGTATSDLASSMFLVESANYRGAAGLEVERIAAEGAKVGHADLTQTTDILTTSLHDYNMAASQAVPTMNSLIQTVKDGKMGMDDLNSSLSNVLPIASSLHVPLADVEGALSVMAAAGDKGSSAGTHLAMMLKMLAEPASTASKEMSAMGINSVQLAEEMQTSLPGALQMIQDAVAQHFTPGSVEYTRAITTILGGSKSGVAGLELMGQSLALFGANVKDIAATMKSGSSDVQGWSLVQQDFNQKMDEAKEKLETIGITIGTDLLPMVGNLFTAVDPLLTDFLTWIDKGNNLQGVLSTVGGVIENDVVTPAGKLWNAVEPIITDFIKWNDQTGFLKNTLQDVGGFINSVAGDIANNIMPPVRSLIGNLEEWLTQSNAVHDALQLLGGAIGTTSQVLGTLIGWVSDLIGGLETGNPLAITLARALVMVGTAIAEIKIAEFVLGLQNAFTQAGGLSGVLKDFASSTIPNVATQLGLVKTAEEEVGTTAATTMAVGVQTGTAVSRGWFADLETEIDATTAKEELVGSTMEGKVAGEVAAGSASSKASLAGIATEAGGIGVALLAVLPIAAQVQDALNNIKGPDNQPIIHDVNFGYSLVGTPVDLSQYTDSAMAQKAQQLAQQVSGAWQEMSTNAQTATATMHDQFLSQLQNMVDKSPQATAQLESDYATKLSTMSGITLSDATTMVDTWGTQTDQMKTLVASNVGQMTKQVNADVDELTNGGISRLQLWKTQSVMTAQDMADQVDTALAKLRDTGVADIQGLTAGATTALNQLHDTAISDAASADQSVATYYNETIAYLQQLQTTKDNAATIAKYHTPTGIVAKNFTNEGTPGHASGGRNIPPGGYLAGEEGPEWIESSVATNVYTASQTRSMLSGSLPSLPPAYAGGYGDGGGSSQPVHIHVHIGGREVGDVLVDDLSSAAISKLGNHLVSHMRLRTGSRV